ncbi:MAG: hypothetical protein IKE22_11845 [Atopobiaceae bacterium]|nr:hypothetical protein [Atopobiaceae bacterium]
MKRNDLLAVGLAATLALGATLQPALAYLTGNARSVGQVPVEPFKTTTIITEPVDGLTKSVTISRDEDSAPVYVRVRVVKGETFGIDANPGEGWSYNDEDGWWYYDGVLDEDNPSTTTLALTVTDVPEGTLDGEYFDIIVIHECTLVQYDEAGEPYADWNQKLINGETTD